jgi:transketolase
MLKTVVGAAKALAEEGVSARVLSMYTVKPLDTDAVLQAVRETKAIVTVEEHGVIGGMGSAVAEVVAASLGGSNGNIPAATVGLRDDHHRHIGSQQYLRSCHGLSVEGIRETVRRVFLQQVQP